MDEVKKNIKLNRRQLQTHMLVSFKEDPQTTFLRFFCQFILQRVNGQSRALGEPLDLPLYRVA